MKSDRYIILGTMREGGITYLEYAMVLTFIGLIIFAASIQFQPKSESFYDKMKPGLDIDYPVGYTELSSS